MTFTSTNQITSSISSGLTPPIGNSASSSQSNRFSSLTSISSISSSSSTESIPNSTLNAFSIPPTRNIINHHTLTATNSNSNPNSTTTTINRYPSTTMTTSTSTSSSSSFPRPSTSTSLNSITSSNHHQHQSPTSSAPPSSFIQPSTSSSPNRPLRPPSPSISTAILSSQFNKSSPSPSNGMSMASSLPPPSYISSRSANSLISESRPTRIQSSTLLALNRLLDELLLMILSSAKSLSTERIKTHGVLKVLNNSNLARNSVLEAELELRSYLDGKRAEGGKVPLGLMATSRWDGTENWPVGSAYGMLRTRCQYYSTLGDLEDTTSQSLSDQHIMSSEGRPIATITPGVAIYVTALLEFVGEYILQKVGVVIERDNSDEASLDDLVAALTEDENLSSVYGKMEIKSEIERMRLEEGGEGKGGKAGKKSFKPRKLWDEKDRDEAVEGRSFGTGKRNSVSATSGTKRIPSGVATSSHERGTSIGTHNSHSTEIDHSVTTPSSSNHATFSETSSSVTSPTTSTSGASGLTRRTSTDRNWGNQIFGGKRRGSLRMSQDGGSSGGKLNQTLVQPTVGTQGLEDEEFEDDFEAALNNPGTMKVSLTPNRLRTIEVTEQEASQKRSSRRRPGTLSPLETRSSEPSSARASPLPSPAPTVKSRSSLRDNDLPPTPGSTKGGSVRLNGSKITSPPPSSYRSPSPVVTNNQVTSGFAGDEDLDDEDRELMGLPPKGKGGKKDLASMGAGSGKLQPRESKVSANLATREMMELFSSTPPGTPQVNQGQRSQTPSLHSNEGTTSVANKRASGVGGRMRNLFGRKGSGSVSGKEAFATPTGSGSNRGSTSSFKGASEGSGSGGYSRDGHGHVSEDNLSSTFADSSSVASQVARMNQQQQVGGSLGRKFSSSTASPPLNAIRRGSQSSLATSSNNHRPTGLNIVESADRDEEEFDRSVNQHDSVSTDLSAQGTNMSSLDRSVDQRSSTTTAAAAAALTGAPSKIVGLYEEPVSESQGQNQVMSTDELSSSPIQSNRPATPPSPPPQSKEPPPSRKIPWTYSRQSSTGRPGSRAGATTPNSEGHRFSANYGSSSGDHDNSAMMERSNSSNATRFSGIERDETVGVLPGGRVAPSAWNSNSRDFNREKEQAAKDRERESSELHRQADPSEKTPTPTQILGFQGPRPRTISSSLGSRDAVRALTELERRMRNATTVEECRSMVSRSLNLALETAGAFAGVAPPDSAEIQDIPDEDSEATHSRKGYGYGTRTSTDRKRSDPPPISSTILAGRTRKPSSGLQHHVTSQNDVPSLPISRAKRPILAMADHNDDEFLEMESSGLVAGWLLDGEVEEPYKNYNQSHIDEESDPLPSSETEVANSGDATLMKIPRDEVSQQTPRKNISSTHEVENENDQTSANNSLENDGEIDADGEGEGYASADEGAEEKSVSNGFLQPAKKIDGLSFQNDNSRLSTSTFSSYNNKKSSPNSIDKRREGRSSNVSSFYSAHED